MPTSPPLIYRRVHRADVDIGAYEGAGVRAVEDAGPYEGVQVDNLLTKADNHNNQLRDKGLPDTALGLRM